MHGRNPDRSCGGPARPGLPEDSKRYGAKAVAWSLRNTRGPVLCLLSGLQGT